MGSNPGSCGESPATDRLSLGTASVLTVARDLQLRNILHFSVRRAVSVFHRSLYFLASQTVPVEDIFETSAKINLGSNCEWPLIDTADRVHV
jgi:hypothetical protein